MNQELCTASVQTLTECTMLNKEFVSYTESIVPDCECANACATLALARLLVDALVLVRRREGGVRHSVCERGRDREQGE